MGIPPTTESRYIVSGLHGNNAVPTAESGFGRELEVLCTSIPVPFIEVSAGIDPGENRKPSRLWIEGTTTAEKTD